MTQPASRSDGVDDDERGRDSFLVVLRRRAPWVLVLTVLGVLAAAGYSRAQAAVYTSTASVSLRAVVVDPFNNTVDVTKTISMQNELVISHSVVVAEKVQTALHTNRTTRDLLRHLVVVNPANTQILSMSFSANTPKQAQSGANAFANSYLAYRKSVATATVGRIVNNLEVGITANQQRRDAITTRLGRTLTAAQKQVLNNEFATVLTNISTTQQQVNTYKALDTTPGQVTQPGSQPSSGGHSTASLLLSGGLLGLLLGLIAARTREATDTRIWRISEAGHLLGAVALTGPSTDRPLAIGRGAWKASGRDAPQADGFRSMAVFLVRRLASADGLRSVAVVSPRRGDGRSEVTIRMSIATAELGVPVTALSADFLRPGLDRFFGEPAKCVTAQVLQDAVPIRTAVHKVAAPAGLSVLPSGNPRGGRRDVVARLSSLGRVIAAEPALGEVVMVDTPAFFEVADALVISSGLDAAIVVVSIGRTQRADLSRLRYTMESFGTPVLGFVPVRHVRVGRFFTRGNSTGLVGASEVATPAAKVDGAAETSALDPASTQR